jgi:hypothetical protein
MYSTCAECEKDFYGVGRFCSPDCETKCNKRLAEYNQVGSPEWLENHKDTFELTKTCLWYKKEFKTLSEQQVCCQKSCGWSYRNSVKVRKTKPKIIPTEDRKLGRCVVCNKEMDEMFVGVCSPECAMDFNEIVGKV